MITVMTLIGLLIMGMAIVLVKDNSNLVQVIVWTLVGYVFFYIINSAVLFWADSFSVSIACGMNIIEMGLLVGVLVLLKKKLSIQLSFKQYLVPFIIFLLVLPVINQKFGFFGMGQDEGVYQTKAIALIQGENSNEYELEETRTMSDEDVTEYKSGISEQYGFYYTETGSPQITKGVFHGISTYPAVLAWWGSMFGYQNMSGVNSMLFFCTIFMLYGLALKLKVSRGGSGIMLLVYAISPIVLWINKSTLCENLITLVFLAYLYLLLDIEKQKNAWISSIPLVVYAVLHVSMYVMMPMFVMVYFLMFLIYKNKQYLIANIICVVAYRLGYMMMMRIAGEYTESNYSFIERLGIKVEQVPFYASVAVLIVVLICSVLLVVPIKKDEKTCIFDSKWLMIILSWMTRIGICICAYYAYRTIKHSLYSYVNATMYAYIWAAAIVIIPYIFIVIFLFPKNIFSKKSLIPLWFIYLYCGIIYPTVLSPIVIYYNYYSRYIAVYLPCVFLFAICLVEQQLEKKPIKFTKKVRVLVYGMTVALALILYTRYDIFMINHQDETRVEWDMVDQVSKQLEPKDALIVDGDLKNQLFYTTKLLSGNKSYPVMENIDKTVKLAKQSCQKIYFVSNQKLSEEAMQSSGFHLIKTLSYNVQIYDKAVAPLGNMPYLRTAYIIPQQVYLYEI